jgi:hypothetical protein
MALKQTTNTRPLMVQRKSKCVGGRNCDFEAQIASLRQVAICADLGGSSKYSNANFED